MIIGTKWNKFWLIKKTIMYLPFNPYYLVYWLLAKLILYFKICGSKETLHLIGINRNVELKGSILSSKDFWNEVIGNLIFIEPINFLHYVEIRFGFMSDYYYSPNLKNKIKHMASDHFQHCLRFMLHFRVSNHSLYSLFSEFVYFPVLHWLRN